MFLAELTDIQYIYNYKFLVQNYYYVDLKLCTKRRRNCTIVYSRALIARFTSSRIENVKFRMCPTHLDEKNGEQLTRKSRMMRRIPLRRTRTVRRAFKCPNCNHRFTSELRLQNHCCKNLPPKDEEDASWKMTQSESWYNENLHIGPQNTEDQGEFIVDCLYLTQENHLLCYSRDEKCFISSDIKEMKIHRETLHPLLESRFGFETWVDAIPSRFWSSAGTSKDDFLNNNFSNSFKRFLSKKQTLKEEWKVKSKRLLQTKEK